MKYFSISILVIFICSCKSKVNESNTTEIKEVVVIDKANEIITNGTAVKSTSNIPEENNIGEPEGVVKIDETKHSNIKLLSYSEISKPDSVIKSNSITFNKKCAISIIPSSKWISAEQEKMGEDGWMTVVEDNSYYLDQGRQVLIKNNIEFIKGVSREKRYMMFMEEDSIVSTIDLHKMEDAWGIILFNGHDTPYLWSGTEIDEDLKFVYNK
ncbi:hypothetical protein KMW28_23980 [Flammeovirga yaeyamensis]|uniref:Uncharacterized protein n=2 Tax=Flammeovirga yaeyamensis TaxID=367791 RepID=A0AAX1NFJ8_9BACT|nr:hypothetical protein [Flammeovirga yaeyamensis]MBB3696561.1 hypothetical protein [Flammeovirga yaeyamensis]NMF33239.1 hypothetical protein [Flammeovirga yaeyamensis]QWG05482.1 hypothetical protein KMW28_23980 [Flammeovirga yaeyamensis]